MPRHCCGEIPKRRNRRRETSKLPPNPPVLGGVRLVYIGAGDLVFKGSKSRLQYAVSNRRRHFKADPRDVDELLKDRAFMLEP